MAYNLLQTRFQVPRSSNILWLRWVLGRCCTYQLLLPSMVSNDFGCLNLSSMPKFNLCSCFRELANYQPEARLHWKMFSVGWFCCTNDQYWYGVNTHKFTERLATGDSMLSTNLPYSNLEVSYPRAIIIQPMNNCSYFEYRLIKEGTFGRITRPRLWIGCCTWLEWSVH